MVGVSRQVVCNLGSETANVLLAVFHGGETLPFSYTVNIRNSADSTTVYNRVFEFTTSDGATDTVTLPNGSYTIHNHNGDQIESFTVNCTVQVCDIAITDLVVTPDINNTGNGTVTITATSSKPDIEYSVDGTNWTSSNVIGGLFAGNKNAIARDSGGCYAYQSFVLDYGSCTIGISSLSVTNETALNANNGTVTSSITGNVGSVTYSINGTTYQADPTFLNLSVGNYTYYAKDSVGCITTQSFSISEHNVVLQDVPEDYLQDEKFTISYQPELESWTSFHSYVPNHYVSKGNRVFMTINDSDTVWELNKGAKGSYFGNNPEDPYKFKITFIVNIAPSETKVWDNMVLFTNSKNGTQEIYTDTFNLLRCETNYQSTGDVQLVIGRQQVISLSERLTKAKAELVNQEFRISIPRDVVADATVDITNPDNWVTSSLFDDTARRFRPQLKDKYMVVTLKYDNTDGYELDLISVKSLFRASAR